MPKFTQRFRFVVLLGLAGVFALVLVGRWLNATKRGGQGPAEPFRIAGNLYYVGATDAAAFLITGPEGHIVLDCGYPSTAPMIIAIIAVSRASGRPRAQLQSAPRPPRRHLGDVPCAMVGQISQIRRQRCCKGRGATVYRP